MLRDNLLMLRSIHGYSQEEVAGKIGISRQAYAKWESGATVPDVEKCARLAHVYGTTVGVILAGHLSLPVILAVCLPFRDSGLAGDEVLALPASVARLETKPAAAYFT